MIIGLTGRAGSGKSTAARFLSREFNFARRPFAYPLKAMIGALGYTGDVLDGDSSIKEAPRPELGGKSIRHAMQTLGTEWGRTHMDPDFWVRMWERGIDRLGHVVADDCRFDNEVRAIRRRGGLIVRIERAGAGTSVNAGHASERVDELSFDVVIENNHGFQALFDKLRELVLVNTGEAAWAPINQLPTAPFASGKADR